MPPVIQSTKGTRARGRASTRGTSKTKTNTTVGRGRGKAVVPDSDEEADKFAIQKPVSNRSEREKRATVATGKGRYGSVVGFAGKAQPLTQTSILSAFSRQSQNTSNTTRTNNSAKNRSILYDSDSD